MTRSIRIGDIGNYCEQQVEQLLRSTVLVVDGKIKERTPRDTARLMAGWQWGENASSSPAPPPGDYRGVEPALKAYNYQPGQEKLGNVYIMHNNVEYAEPVIMGTGLPPSWGGVYRTRQGTVPGFPDLVAREAQSFVQTGWEAIKRRG